MTVAFTPAGISADDLVAIARHGAPVTLHASAIDAINRGRAVIDALADSDVPVYGVSTGFGALATVAIPADKRADLQRAIVRSHAAGMGDPVEVEVVRGLMALRLKTLASGRTGIRLETAQAIVDLLNNHITPVVPEFGSLGCSGDLAPLAHCALVLMGEGEAWVAGDQVPAAVALARHGLSPVTLAEKEGLALLNGTEGMLAMLLLALADLDHTLTTADVVAAMSVEALRGTDAAFAAELHAPIRKHPGQALSAAVMWACMADSQIVKSHADDTSQVQDAYSLRCAPQVTGAVRDVTDSARITAERELDSIIDNPIVMEDGSVRSNGNFHGAPLAYAADFLAIALADLASISERRTDRMLDPARDYGLPAFLAGDAGVDSGLMIAQYTQAGIVAEMKRDASPASVDSIPSSAMQEDHVSMGWNAARKLRRSVINLQRVIGIELMTSARALDLRAPHAPGPVAAAVVAKVRESVPGVGTDRYLSPEMNAAFEIVASAVIPHIATQAMRGTSRGCPLP